MENTIEVNGEKWIAKERKESLYRMPKMISDVVMMAMAMGGGVDFTSGHKKEPSIKVNIVEEYALIQQKKSTLSRSQRDAVIAQFEYNFKKVSP